MNEASKTFAPTICGDTLNAISLQESGSGPTACAKQDGATTDLYGQSVALASLSARQARAMGLLTSGTSGQQPSTSSQSAVLALALANKCKKRLSTVGSTLYKLTWKILVTPLGRRVYVLQGLALRTSGSVFTGWVTPNTRDWKDTPGQTTLSTNPDGSKRVRLDQTPRQAAQWVGFGRMQSGSISETGKSALFNPALARWLIGLPTTWDDAAPTEMR